MLEANAILAIDSLDRFVTTDLLQITRFNATWLINSTQLTFLSEAAPPIKGGAPIVGAALIQGNGLQEGTIVLSYDPLTQIIVINLPTTSAQTNVPVTQIYTATTSYYNDFLQTNYFSSKPYSFNFTLQSQTSWIYGYMYKMVVTQVQLQYNIPTINLDLNDTIYINDYAGDHLLQKVQIPYGFYYPDELAAALETLIRANTTFTDMDVQFFPRDGFQFTSATDFYFPGPNQVNLIAPGTLDNDGINNVYRTYRLLGITAKNDKHDPVPVQQSSKYPNFLYTPYIDIYSDTLTNYQKIKDTNTTQVSQKGLLARVYLSGTGQNQTTGPLTALGTAPFVMTADLNNPKVIRWTPDVALTTIDIQLKDQYGNFIPGADEGFSTEFQMTLLCTEAERN